MSIDIAERHSLQIVSVDSMLVYRDMDIGTAKPSMSDRARVPHHLIDIVDPATPFSVAEYQERGRRVLGEVGETRCLLVGGSGLYFRSLADDLSLPGTDPQTRAEIEREAGFVGGARLHMRLAAFDPVAAGRIEPQNVRRTVRALEVAAVTGRPFSEFAADWETYPSDRVRVAGVRVATDALNERIVDRVEGMIRGGFVQEVSGLLGRGFGSWLTSSRAIGYEEIAGHLSGSSTLDEAITQTVGRTRALARRQMAWFRRDPRVRWFDVGSDGAREAGAEIEAYLMSS